jgi:hypothetical protein
MTAKPLLRHRAQLACGGILAAVAIAGCGSSSSTGTSASASTGAPGGGGARTQLSSKVTACLKQHGITLPSGGGRGRGFGGPPSGGAGYGGPPTGAGAGRPPSGATGSGGPAAGASGKSGKARFRGRPPGAGFAGSSKMRAALKACGVGGSSS